MARVKGAKHALKRRRTVLKLTKGYRFGKSTKERQANEALYHAGNHAFRDRRDKKNNFRRLWTTRINAALRQIDEKLSYSKFIDSLNKNEISIDRKILSNLAAGHPEIFKKIVDKVNK